MSTASIYSEWQKIKNSWRKNKERDDAMSSIEGEFHLRSHDSKVVVTVQQASSSSLVFTEVESGIVAYVPAKKWWDFIIKVNEIEFDVAPTKLTFCDHK